MKLSTPINGLKSGELYTIRDSYSKMLNESAENAFREGLFRKIYESVKTSDYEKLTKFAKKNTKLCNCATKSAIKKACNGIECDEATLNEVCKRVKCAIDSDLDVFKKKCKEISVTAKKQLELQKNAQEPVNEADYDDNEDDEPFEEPVYRNVDDRRFSRTGGFSERLSKDDLKKIDDLTKDYDKDSDDDDDGDSEPKDSDAEADNSDDTQDTDDYSDDDETIAKIGNRDVKTTFMKPGEEFDDTEKYSSDSSDYDEDRTFNKVGHGFLVTRIRAALFIKNKKIGPTVPIYVDVMSENDKFTNAVVDFDEVIDLINKKSGIYFNIEDYTADFRTSETKASPQLLAGKVVTSDLVEGSDTLNSIFGPKGRYADYLYNVDGTPKYKPNDSETEDMTDTEKDVGVVSAFPKIYVNAFVYKVSKGSSNKKPITEYDVSTAGIKIVK